MTNIEPWSTYWKQNQSSGEVFVNKDGAKHPDLIKFWRERFSNISSGARVLDIACGGGSIFSSLGTNKSIDFFASDISLQALKLFNQNSNTAFTIVSSATQLPFRDNAFDYIVSQFGVEYAGEAAFNEISRLLHPQGKLTMLCHFENGYIDGNNKEQLSCAQMTQDIHFIEKAIDLTAASFGNDKSKYQQALSAFIPSERILVGIVKKCPNGVHTQLYAGFKQLYERINHYQPQDIIKWLEDMATELDKTVLRLAEMRRATLSEQQVQNIANMLSNTCSQRFIYKPFQTKNSDIPIAWEIYSSL